MKRTCKHKLLLISTTCLISILVCIGLIYKSQLLRWASNLDQYTPQPERDSYIIDYIQNNKRDLNKFYVSSKNNGETTVDFKDFYIAHGGGIGKYTYTNSLDSFLDSMSRGFKFIEIDMLTTSDNKLIGGHDWDSVKKTLGLDPQTSTPLSLSDLSKGGGSGSEKILSGAQIKNLMNDHPDLILVTDKITDYSLLLKEIPFPNRMIVEVFSVQQYYDALKHGIKYPAFCVRGKKQLADFNKFNFPIITLGPRLLRSDKGRKIVKSMHDAGTTILFFTVRFPTGDTADFLNQHLGVYFSKVYTDRWSPKEPHNPKIF